MKNILKNCSPEKLFAFFEEISSIPRGSGNEKEIADYLERFAADRGLYCKRDDLNNVFIRKKAAPCQESRPAVLFQAHTDMVFVARDGARHDFLTVPPELMTDGKYIFAKDTSLGADDGVGVAVMLTLIDDDTLLAPETEYLFTSCEETGMDGARGFDYSEVRAGLVINLDSEEEFNACIGCAGGIHAKTLIPAESVKTEGKICAIEIGGLASGHSGIDADKGRRSAIKLLALLLNRLYKGYPFHIVSLRGGTKDNVIPGAAKAVIAFADNAEAKKAKAAVSEIKKELTRVLSKEDRRAFYVKLTSIGNTASAEENAEEPDELHKTMLGGMLSLKSTSALISALMLSPQGVTDRYMGKSFGVAGSVNLGTVRIKERAEKGETTNESACSAGGFSVSKTEGLRSDRSSALGKAIELNYLIRSGSPFFSEKTLEEIERLSHLCGGTTGVVSRYPGWDSKEGERLQALYADAVRELYGREAVFSRVHAGLECGIIYENLRKRGIIPEIISIGPDTENIHTVDERLSIESFARFYETVKTVLEKA